MNEEWPHLKLPNNLESSGDPINLEIKCQIIEKSRNDYQDSVNYN